MASDETDWGFDASADIMPYTYISLQTRPNGKVAKLYWQFKKTADGAYYYECTRETDATQDMLDAEDRIYQARMDLIRDDN